MITVVNDRDIFENFLRRGHVYDPITERYDNHESKKKPWVEDFFKALGYALFLARQEEDCSLRQGYILLDNNVEQFLKSYLKSEMEENLNKRIDFPSLISKASENTEKTSDILDNILYYHQIRNKLYHSAVYLTISKAIFLDYLSEIFSFCKLIGFDNPSEIVSDSLQKINSQILQKMNNERCDRINKIEDLIKDNFGLTPGDYQGDILLGSAPGYTRPAIEGIKSLLFGILDREKVAGVKARLLEVIEANQKNAYHSFIISYSGSSTWYFFYNCFWSHWGEGNDPDIERIRKWIDNNEDYIDYKVTRVKRGYFEGAFDPFFTN